MKANFENTYEHIGYLLYGIACRKDSLSAEDRLRLAEFIDKNWRGPGNGDALSFHLVDCIHIGVRYAIVNSMRPEEALKSFSDFYRVHTLSFGDVLKKKIESSALQLGSETSSETRIRVESFLENLFNTKATI